jgi:hypothetical protein
MVQVKTTPEMELRLLRNKRQSIKEDIAALEEELVKTNVSILKHLNKMGKKEVVLDGLNTQIIQAYKTTYDWNAIREEVDPEVWATIVKEVPSQEALTAAIAQGSISPTVVAKHATKTPREPYIKVDKAAAPRMEEE